jgi:hypothetical protein
MEKIMAEYKKRLIYANDVEFALQAICDRESGVPLITAEWLASVVRKAPTVDAVEVVHGRWIEKEDMVASYLEDFTEVFYECSVCRTPNYGETIYCPNCGAKMDGDGNE